MSAISFRKTPFFRLVVLTVLAAFTGMLPAQPSYAQMGLILPLPGQMIHMTSHFEPPQMIGVKINPKDPFSFGFIMNQGESPMSDTDRKEEFNKIIKYFLVSLTMPNKEMWVNLSPYESNRIMPEVFGQTEMGRDLLAQDYILKQFTASLIYPEAGLGKKFWAKVYQEAQERFGTTDIKVNTFNKVWIVADKADVYQKEDTAFLVGKHLKVMLEQDFMAIDKNKEQFGNVQGIREHSKDAKAQMASAIVREIIVPAIEKEVNEGKSFAGVRQVYSAEIMATWFKKTLRQSLLGQVFADKSKVAGQKVDDPRAKEKIYKQYLRAYKKGVFNYIKEDETPDGQIIPRKYFSGGVVPIDRAMVRIISGDMAALPSKDAEEIHAFVTKEIQDFAMSGNTKDTRKTRGGKTSFFVVISLVAGLFHAQINPKPSAPVVPTTDGTTSSLVFHQDVQDIKAQPTAVRSTASGIQQVDSRIRTPLTGNLLVPTSVIESDIESAIKKLTETSMPPPPPHQKVIAFINQGSPQAVVSSMVARTVAGFPLANLSISGSQNTSPNLGQHGVISQVLQPDKNGKHVGGINLSDEHLTLNIKVDGAGMPLAAQYQSKALMNLNGLTSIIRKISPITPQNVPALYELIK